MMVVSLFAGINASLNQSSFFVNLNATIVIGVTTDAKPPVNFDDVNLMRLDGKAISDADSRITKVGSSIVFQNVMPADSGNYAVMVMHPARNRTLQLALEICEFAVVFVCSLRTDVTVTVAIHCIAWLLGASAL